MRCRIGVGEGGKRLSPLRTTRVKARRNDAIRGLVLGVGDRDF